MIPLAPTLALLNNVSVPQLIVWAIFTILVLATCVIPIGLIASAMVPGIHGASNWLSGIILGCAGMLVGFLFMWTITWIGKLLFGKVTHTFDTDTRFTISQPGGHENAIIIQLGEDVFYEWHDVFYRRTDRLHIFTKELTFNDAETYTPNKLVISDELFSFDREAIPLHHVTKCSGTCTKVIVPREAVGFGVVKFLAMIGAFIGFKWVLFTGAVSVLLTLVCLPLFRRTAVLGFAPFIAVALLVATLVRLFF